MYNRIRAQLQVVAVKAPGFGDNRKNTMADMAVLTNGYVFGAEGNDETLENIKPEHFGGTGEIVVTKDDTLLLDGAGAAAEVAARADQIRDMIDETKSDYEKEKLEERLARLVGGVAVVKVGGSSEVEVGERKDRVVDAYHATKAAIEEGIVPGGGAALLRCISNLDSLEAANFDQQKGVEIIQRAIRAPTTQVRCQPPTWRDAPLSLVVLFMV